MLPTGVYFESYSSEARLLKTVRSRVWLGALLVALCCVPLVSGPYFLGVMTYMFISLMAVYGLYITVGMAGQINIAQSAFVGVGALMTAKFSEFGVPFWAAIPLAALVTGLVSIIFALPAARVKGFYLALTTLAAQIMFPTIIFALPANWLGGLVGMPVTSASIGSFTISSPVDFYFLTLAIVLALSVLAFNLRRTRFGRALIAVRDNDVVAEVMGMNVLKIKALAFFTGSLFAGVAGGCTAYFLQFVTVESFTLFASVWYLGMLIVGGIHSPIGAVLGVVFITFVQEGLHGVATFALQSGAGSGGGAIFALTSIVLGGLILLALIFEPRGLAHRWSVLQTTFQLWPFPRN
ncbi:branched-chain amino acid ABC transporter permease [Sneathiella sp.]|uniref:branched-chain amino acid ABC transporter permease n=1 Tax=Sneathiella sp. TaxID=1964365 RepID=UPI002FE1A62E